jgi:hypothetical protein
VDLLLIYKNGVHITMATMEGDGIVTTMTLCSIIMRGLQ